MARQIGTYKITGTVDEICFYKMNGKYYARLKSSLTGKRVKKDPAFANTMRYAGLLAEASKIASAIYRQLVPEQKEKGLYKRMTGQAMRLLKESHCPEIVKALMERSYTPPMAVLEKKVITTDKTEVRDAFADMILEKIFGETTVWLNTGQYRLIENTAPS